jgi:predicted CXXCH cytochrome family protein
MDRSVRGNRKIKKAPLKRVCWCVLSAFILLFSCGEVSAQVVGSPHDLYNQGYLILTGEVLETNPQCLDCHFSPPDQRPQIWKTLPPSLEEYGQTGILCASCHDGVSMVDRNVDAGLTVFHPRSHGLDAREPPIDTDFSNMGLPNLIDNMLSCTTCHDPHSSINRPFLKVPQTGLCKRCHVGKEHREYGVENETGSHPVSIEPYDDHGGPSPISVQPYFAVPFPRNYPLQDASILDGIHWTTGGHLSFGDYGKIECFTCHALHGSEDVGPAIELLSKDPVRDVSDEFCEGCHRGERGDEREEPPFPNPGGTITGRTYHPVDDDEANGAGRIVAIADTSDLIDYIFGEEDPDSELPRILCTTCHRAHNGMSYSPALVNIYEPLRDDSGITTFCEICHREFPEGHHGVNELSDTYFDEDLVIVSPQIPYVDGTEDILIGDISINLENLGMTFGTPEPGKIYCSHCHKAHNAGYERNEMEFIPILVSKGQGLCEDCHNLGVSHFLGDPNLPSNYDTQSTTFYRDMWPFTGKRSYYEGDGENPTTVTCYSCHYMKSSNEQGGGEPLPYNLLAPAGEYVEWFEDSPEDYLCTGCHGDTPATVGSGRTHPLLTADSSRFPNIQTDHLIPGETPASYTEDLKINCHSCHRAHRATVPGGLYILKAVRGNNTDPKAIRPRIRFETLCYGCHPSTEY